MRTESMFYEKKETKKKKQKDQKRKTLQWWESNPGLSDIWGQRITYWATTATNVILPDGYQVNTSSEVR